LAAIPADRLPGVKRIRGRGIAWQPGMFVFFSNRLGCLGSIIVSIIGTILLALLIRACMSSPTTSY
jgi:hypothetical protein